MATVNGKSGTFNITTKNPYISGYVKWQETYDDKTYIQTNKSKVTLTAYLHRTNIYDGNSTLLNYPAQRIAYFGNENVTDNSNVSFTIAGNTSSSGGAYTQVYSASKEITHDLSGSKSLTVGFFMTVYGEHNSFEVEKKTATATLTTIPRYLSVNSLEVTSIEETSAVVKWSVSDARNSTYFSLDNGATWTGSATWGEWISSTYKSGNFNIKNLNPNQSYKMKVKFKRTDSGLWTESETISFKTYDYPRCVSNPQFTIGDALTLDFYNPLGRTIKVVGFSKNDDAEIFSGETAGTRLVGFNDANSVNRQYNSIPDSESGEYRVRVEWNGVYPKSGWNTYHIRGDEVPTINGFDYLDNNSEVVAITGNNQLIVQNKSRLLVRMNEATPNYGAGSIEQYYVWVNGKGANGNQAGAYDLGTIDSEEDVDLTLEVLDSRGLVASKTIKVSMLAHKNPTALVTLQRLNNYEDETYLTVDGSVSSLNGTNTMSIQYRYRLSNGGYGIFQAIGDRETHTLSLDKNNVYIFNVIVTDVFGDKFDGEFTLNKGLFPLFIDTEKNSVGINCFPKYKNSFEVNGEFYPEAKTIDSLSSYDDITGDLKRSGFYTAGQGNTWCNLINLRHRNGEGDGAYYGLQIRNTMLTKRSKLQVRQHDSTGWGAWRWLQEEGDVLFDDDNGNNSTVNLTEDIGNFSSAEIFYSLKSSGVDYYSSVKVDAPRGKNCSLFSALPNGGYVIVGMGTILFEGATIKFTSNNTFLGSDMNNPVTGNEMYIFKVLGYR